MNSLSHRVIKILIFNIINNITNNITKEMSDVLMENVNGRF